ncbi:hypothetical protein Asi02nite_03450 [Asanoa siamensis]|uniref:Uncharacterized protein n=2 Tax=Asanoa siamensis TaxID=926357 RepID=A0ABQ4CHR7_9ACTN|nr:hypothetical protein Asi02nite_03450 [Asanoa siamensis]
MVNVTGDGAFSVNGVGVDSAPFPLAFSLDEVAGCWLVSATAAQASELADLLAAAAGLSVAVVNLATNSYVDEDFAPWPSARIAAAQGVRAEVHDFGALSDGVNVGSQGLVLRATDLPAFLDGWSPYELAFAGLSHAPSAGDLDALALTVGTTAGGDSIVANVPGATLWYSGHDDCYVWMETVDRSWAIQLLARLLALHAGSALVDGVPVEIVEPREEVVERLLAQSPHWVGVVADSTPGTLAIELSATAGRWRLGDALPEEVDRTATYDIADGDWRLSRLPLPPSGGGRARPRRG